MPDRFARSQGRGDKGPSRWRLRLLTVALVAVAWATFGVVSAMADAADPVPASTTGSVATLGDGSRQVTVQGSWQWTTHHSDCNNDKRAVGVAVDWNDPSSAGNHVDTLNGVSIDVGTPSDNIVHPAMPGTDSSTYTAWRGGCGAFDPAKGYNSGSWGPLQHTYPSSFTGQITICALMYDVHLQSNGGAPNGQKEITAGGSGHNDDNSAQSNKNTPLGNGCFTTTIAPPQTQQIAIVKSQAVNATSGYTPNNVNARLGDTINYQIVVTNTGDATLNNFQLADPGCTGFTQFNSSQTVVKNGTLTYICSHAVTASDVSAGVYRNTASETATGPNGSVGPVTSQVTANITPTTVVTNNPRLTVLKQQRNGSTSGSTFTSNTITGNVGDTILYQLLVTNTGDVALNNVSVTDPGCTGLSPASVSPLAVGAEATFTCSHLVTAADQAAGSFTNGSTANPCSAQATSASQVSCNPVTVTVPPPGGGTPPSTPPATPTTTPPVTTTPNPPAVVAGLRIVKTQRIAASGGYTRGQITAKVGDEIEYRIVVTNTGNTSLSVVLTDGLCDSGTMMPSGTVKIAAGASETYRCSHVASASDASTITNTAIAVGTTPTGGGVGPVSSTVRANKAVVLAAKKVHKVKKVVKKPVVKKPVVKKPVVKKPVVKKHVTPVKHIAGKPKPVTKPAQFTG